MRIRTITSLGAEGPQREGAVLLDGYGNQNILTGAGMWDVVVIPANHTGVCIEMRGNCKQLQTIHAKSSFW